MGYGHICRLGLDDIAIDNQRIGLIQRLGITVGSTRSLQ